MDGLSAEAEKALERDYYRYDDRTDRAFNATIFFRENHLGKFVVDVLEFAENGVGHSVDYMELDTIEEAEREIEALAWHYMALNGEAD